MAKRTIAEIKDHLYQLYDLRARAKNLDTKRACVEKLIQVRAELKRAREEKRS